MWKNYMLVALRNMLRHKAFSAINIGGLALGMTLSLLLIMMLMDQYRYDNFHPNKDRVYRILSNTTGSRQAYATSPFPLAEALKSEYPAIEEATRLRPGIGGDATAAGKTLAMRGYFTDPSFLEVFGFSLITGDKATALEKPFSVILSKTFAEALFPGSDPIGQMIDFKDRNLPFPIEVEGQEAAPDEWGVFTVTGIVDLSGVKSHLHFDALVSEQTIRPLVSAGKLPDQSDDWENYFQTYTYVLAKPETSLAGLSQILDDFVLRKYAGIESDQTKGFKLEAQALSDIQLGLVGNDTNNRMPRIGYFFIGFLAVVVLLLACLNYTNLSIARALTRVKEIGLRKVTGASRRSLVTQFLSESILTSLIALGIAVLLLFVIRPAFTSLWVNQFLQFELPSNILVYLLFVGFAIVMGIIAGIYPAFYMSSYQPIKALKHIQFSKKRSFGIRKVLSAGQFIVSLLFITAALVIHNQFKHYMAFDYGFDPSSIVNIDLQGEEADKLIAAFSSVPGVVSVSATDIVPAVAGNNGAQIRKAGSDLDHIPSSLLYTNESFVETLGIDLLSGRNLDGISSSDVLVNQSAVKALGYTGDSEIIGQYIENQWGQENLRVVGVVEDFRFKILANSDDIGPLIMRADSKAYKFLNVKISDSDVAQTLAALKSTWQTTAEKNEFKYKFYEDQLASTHQALTDLVKIVGFVAFLAVVIACLGLLGMVAYAAERKTREIAVRKVLGAANRNILFHLSREFGVVLVVAVLLGGPLSYYFNEFWLRMIPNRTDYGLDTILLAVALMVLLGFLTILSQTWRASHRNPVEALKVE